MSQQASHERADRECGEHRPGLGRSWCFEDREWCYPGEPCRGCELPTLRAEVERLRAENTRLRTNLGATLEAHYLYQIVCDHDTGRDMPYCSCSRLNLGWHPTVGDAARAWVSHVLAAVDQTFPPPPLDGNE